MEKVKCYEEDLIIAKALLEHDETVTRKVFYKQLYPLFKSIFDNYYTDCTNCREFIDEIYLLILAPSKKTNKCQLDNYRGESSLPTWIKTVCLYYCYNKYEHKNRMPRFEQFENDSSENVELMTDRLIDQTHSIEMDLNNINYEDVMKLINMMPCKRYGNLIKFRFLEQKDDKETAEALGMTMSNYYNKKILAVEQYKNILIKDEYRYEKKR